MVGNDTNTTIQPILPKVPIAQEKEEGHSIFALFILSGCLTVVGLDYLFFCIRALIISCYRDDLKYCSEEYTYIFSDIAEFK